MTSMCVVISDLVNDFFHPKGRIAFPSCNHIVPSIKMLCDEARKRDIPIVFVGDSLRIDGKTPELEIWTEHCIRGSWGAKFLDILGEPTAFFEKEGFTPFFGENGKKLIDFLRTLDVDTLILGGVCMPEIKSTAQIASIEPGLRDPARPELGWDIVIPNDCVGDCHMERMFDANNELHLLKGNRGTKMKVTTVWELVAKDFDLSKIDPYDVST